jgi:hypothetical protein
VQKPCGVNPVAAILVTGESARFVEGGGAMLDGTAANRALDELDAVRDAIDEGRFSEAALRIELLERDIAGRDAVVVDIWQRLLIAERARLDHGTGEQTSETSRPA